MALFLSTQDSVRSFRPGTRFRLVEHTQHSLQRLLKQTQAD
ncbi:hypothetical protein HNQ59_003946, partial [Chitinivorax tropicus]|nr:hypothetical protein [Chitinivorax tropicus]